MKISVIIPAYNAAQTICTAIDSVLGQSYAETDIVIVNDGSSDNIEEVISKYESRVKLVSIPNGGVANARNVGLAYAEGDFVMFLDADDRLKPDCFENIIKEQQLTNADVVRFGYELDYGDGELKKPLNYFKKRELILKHEFPEKIYPYYINGIMLNSVCMTLFRKELLDNISFRVDMKTAEDAIFSMQAYTRAEKVLIIPDAYYVYNQTGGSLTGSGLALIEKYKCNIQVSKEIIHLLPQWRMNSPLWQIRAAMRPVVLTFDKLRRMGASGGGEA